MRSFLAYTLFFVALVQSNPVQLSKVCKKYTLPIKTTSTNLKWNLKQFENNYDIATYYNEFGRRDNNVTFKPVIDGRGPESAMYNLAGTYCEPASGGSGTVIVATHGGGFDRSYVHNSLYTLTPK
jgi:hypothetical protein